MKLIQQVLNGCVAFRNTIINEANNKQTNKLQFHTKSKEFPMEKGYMVQIHPAQDWWPHQGRMRGWGSDALIMPSVNCTGG